MDDESNPPLMDTYQHLFGDNYLHGLLDAAGNDDDYGCDLPVVDLAVLEQGSDAAAAELCRAEIVRAATDCGFFQVTNHGVPEVLLDKLHEEQVRMFRRPFPRKVNEPLLDFSPESYRWGTPTATSLEQLSWSEAYHIPITPPSTEAEHDDQVTAADEDDNHTRHVIEEVSTAMWQLAQQLASILIRELQRDDDHEMMTSCTRSTCFLRLNRYPPCHSGSAFGLCPHTDSDFLTILRPQDSVGGLQLLKAGRWLTVKPSPGALVVNVGDLLQAWSNDLYRSVEHRVVAQATRERFSAAFFLCPSYDTVIHPGRRPEGSQIESVYSSFTFGEYRSRIREDVNLTGRKIGLPRFRRHARSLPESSHTIATT